jgi:hypothetical protein
MTEPNARPPGPRWRLPLQALLVVGVVVLAFRPVLSAGFQLTWDDSELLLNNPRWRGLGWEQLRWMATAFHMGHYHPLTWVSFALDHAVWGMNPFGYHLTSLCLHAANAVLFLLLARGLLRRAGCEDPWIAPVAALFFAVHPMRVESVAWVTERRDVLSGFFLLAALLAWLRYLPDRRRAWYAAALALFVSSLLAKPWGMTLPFVLLLLDAWPFARFTRPYAASLTRLALEKLPFFALSAGAAVVAWLAQRASGAMDYAHDFSLAQRAAQACYGLVYYVRESLWPVGLLPIYDLPRDLDPAEPRFLASILAVVGAGVALALVRRRLPALVVTCSIYAIVVSPVLGFAQSGRQLVADRYSYLACMPLALLAAVALERAGRGRATDMMQRAARGRAALRAVPLVAALAWLTSGYSAVWKDSFSLWDHAVRGAPDCAFARTHRGMLYMLQGDGTRALADFDAALSLDPDAAETLEARALLYRKAGRIEDALADLAHAIAVRPDGAVAFANRGTIRFERGDAQGALDDFETAVRLDDASSTNWFNVAIAKERLGDVAGARAATLAALEREPRGTPFRRRMQQALDGLP